MNKHQYTAIFIGIVAIIGAFVLWTAQVSRLPLPDVPRRVVTEFQNALDAFFGAGESAQEVRVFELTVEDLGAHFATRVQKTHITASVTQSEQRQPIDREEHIEVPSQIQAYPAARELTQWDLSPVWTIAIPSLGIRAPVLLPSMQNWTSRAWDLLEEQMQIGLNHGTVAYPHSAAPGDKGNLILAGHSSPPTESAEESDYGDIFAKLPDIEIGEEIRVSSVRYRVEEKFVVSPQMTSILEQQSDESILKLITCYPVGTTKDRMIVLAKKIEE